MSNSCIKKSLGIAALMVSVSGVCFAATPKEDDALQKLGLEYNRRYDIEHGYAVADTAYASAPAQVNELRSDEMEDDLEPGSHVVEVSEISEAEKARNREEIRRIEWELDQSVQAAGLAYNERLDSARPSYVRHEDPETVRRLVNTAPAVSGVSSVGSSSGAVAVPNSTSLDRMPKVIKPKPAPAAQPRYKVAMSRDEQIQLAASEYNRRYDAHYGY